MTTILWLFIAGCFGGIVYLGWRQISKARERERSEEARFAAFMETHPGEAGTTNAPPAPAPPRSNSLETQKLLFDAARKAGDAGETALAIQLYGRLLARFPDSAFAGEVRAAVETQKKKLAKT